MVHLKARENLKLEDAAEIWKKLRDLLTPDHGLLLDMYVENTSAEDWRQFLHFLHAGSYRTEYRYGEDWQSVPHGPEELFQRREQTHLIRIDLGDLWLHCHCFDLEEIELDLDPAEVNNAGQAGKLVRFLAELANAVKKDVILTPESFKEGAFLVMHADR